MRFFSYQTSVTSAGAKSKVFGRNHRVGKKYKYMKCLPTHKYGFRRSPTIIQNIATSMLTFRQSRVYIAKKGSLLMGNSSFSEAPRIMWDSLMAVLFTSYTLRRLNEVWLLLCLFQSSVSIWFRWVWIYPRCVSTKYFCVPSKYFLWRFMIVMLDYRQIKWK